jgi:hypothetical protein
MVSSSKSKCSVRKTAKLLATNITVLMPTNTIYPNNFKVILISTPDSKKRFFWPVC